MLYTGQPQLVSEIMGRGRVPQLPQLNKRINDRAFDPSAHNRK